MRAAGDEKEVDVAAVEALIEERSLARRSRDWSTADAIRDELRDDHNVELYDSDLQWQVGQRGQRSNGGGGGKGGFKYDASNYGPLGHDYEREDDSEMPEETTAVVDELLASRLEAKSTCTRARTTHGLSLPGLPWERPPRGEEYNSH